MLEKTQAQITGMRNKTKNWKEKTHTIRNLLIKCELRNTRSWITIFLTINFFRMSLAFKCEMRWCLIELYFSQMQIALENRLYLNWLDFNKSINDDIKPQQPEMCHCCTDTVTHIVTSKKRKLCA